jgi:outer membrane protein assembly factor BamB
MGIGELCWEAELGTKIERGPSSVIATEAYVLVANYDGGLVALDADDGTELWDRPLCLLGDAKISGLTRWNDYAVVSLAPVDIYAGVGQDARLAIVDVEQGQEVWGFALPKTGSLSVPVIHEDIAYFSAATLHGAVAFALNLATQQVVWSRDELPRWHVWPPVITEHQVWFGLGTPSLVGYDLAYTGQSRRGERLHLGDTALFAVAGEEREVFVVSDGCMLHRIDMETGKPVDRCCDVRRYTSPPRLRSHHLYVGAEDAVSGTPCILCYEVGERLSRTFRLPLTRQLSYAPILTDELIIFVDDGGQLGIVEHQSRRDRARLKTGLRLCSSLHHGAYRVFMAGRDGQVQARFWRQPTELPESAEAYERAGEWELAGLAYTLKRDWPHAARCFEADGQWLRARTMYELAGDHAGVARMSEQMGDLSRALTSWDEANEDVKVTVTLEKLGRFREAGDRWLNLKQPQRAADAYVKAEAYEHAFDALMSADDVAAADALVDKLPPGVRRAAAYERREHFERAAELWDDLGQSRRAAEAYVKAKLWRQAARIYYETAQWRDLCRLSSKPDVPPLWTAEALEHLAEKQSGLWLDVARAYARVAEDLLSPEGPEACGETRRHRAADYYEKAAAFAAEAYDDETRLRYEYHVVQCRRWPKLALAVEPSEDSQGFLADHWDFIDVDVENRGFGLARNLTVELSGAVDPTSKEICEQLRPDNRVRKSLNVRFPPEEKGRRELAIILHFERPDGQTMAISKTYRISISADPDAKPRIIEVRNGNYIENAENIDHHKGHNIQLGDDDWAMPDLPGMDRSFLDDGPVGGASGAETDAEWRCPTCGRKIRKDENFLFCPNCSADLKPDVDLG